MVKQAGAGDRLRAALDAALPRPKAPRLEVLNIRLSADEGAALRAEAERRGVPAATLARVLLVEALALATTPAP